MCWHKVYQSQNKLNVYGFSQSIVFKQKNILTVANNFTKDVFSDLGFLDNGEELTQMELKKRNCY